MGSFINREDRKENPSCSVDLTQHCSGRLWLLVLTAYHPDFPLPLPHRFSPLSLLLQRKTWPPSILTESLHLCPGWHPLLSAQEPLLSIIFCLPGPLVSTGPAQWYFREPCSSLSQGKWNQSLDPIFPLQLCAASPWPAFPQPAKLLGRFPLPRTHISVHSKFQGPLS